MFKFLLLFITGAIGYGTLEIVWRGYTHWSMLVLGGLCLYALYFVFGLVEEYPVLVKALAGGILITAAEFSAGYILNIRLRWEVWSYAAVPFNLMGQICLPYSLLWSGLSIPLSYLCGFFRQYIR